MIEKLRRAAEILRELGGEENYDLADACEDAARDYWRASLGLASI
jgi:hypothetical protein